MVILHQKCLQTPQDRLKMAKSNPILARNQIPKVLAQVLTAKITQSSHTETTRACQMTKMTERNRISSLTVV